MCHPCGDLWWGVSVLLVPSLAQILGQWPYLFELFHDIYRRYIVCKILLELFVTRGLIRSYIVVSVHDQWALRKHWSFGDWGSMEVVAVMVYTRGPDPNLFSPQTGFRETKSLFLTCKACHVFCLFYIRIAWACPFLIMYN